MLSELVLCPQFFGLFPQLFGGSVFLGILYLLLENKISALMNRD